MSLCFFNMVTLSGCYCSHSVKICSKKQNTKSDGTEPSMGWNWLERWMATRQIEVSHVEDYSSNQLINNEGTTIMKTCPSLKKRFQSLYSEEKESCGSNELIELRGFTGRLMYSVWQGSKTEQRAIFVDEVNCVGWLVEMFLPC